MKRTTLWRNCTLLGVVATFALCCVNYLAVLAAFVLTGICAIAWLATEQLEQANKREQAKQYHERLISKG